MAVTSKSDFLKKAKSLGKEAVEANKEKSAPIMQDTEICDLLALTENTKKTFEARLSKVRYGIDKNGSSYFSLDFVLMSGKKGLQVGEFIGLPKDNKETRKKRLQILLVKIEQLGYSMDGATATNIMEKMVAASEQLTLDKPYVTLALSRYVMQNGNSSLNTQILAMSDKVSEEEIHEVAVAAEQPIDFASLGELADNGDEDASAALTAIGEQLEVDVNEYPTWAEFAEYAQGELTVPEAEEAEEESTDDGYENVEEITDEEKEYGESCVGYNGSYTDADGDTIPGIVDSYDPETNNVTFTGEDGTEYLLPADALTFDE